MLFRRNVSPRTRFGSNHEKNHPGMFTYYKTRVTAANLIIIMNVTGRPTLFLYFTEFR